MKYYIFINSGYEYKMKIKNIPKLVAVAYNYCGDLYCLNDDDNYMYIYCDGEDIEFKNEMLKPYGIELKLIPDETCGEIYVPFYKGENLYEKYKDIKVEDIGKEIK